MTKWTLPEGRKPLTDADIAALTRRLAGTAVDYKELYEAAKRDAEEAEAYAEELEKERDAFKANADWMYAERMDAQDRAEAAEAKLASTESDLAATTKMLQALRKHNQTLLDHIRGEKDE